jgi:hypothetical protein
MSDRTRNVFLVTCMVILTAVLVDVTRRINKGEREINQTFDDLKAQLNGEELS